MNERTMIKVRCSKNLLDVWTISRTRKSPRSFAILRSELQQLEQKPESRLISYEEQILRLIYERDVPISKIAQKNHISRQAINQVKLRAECKLRKYLLASK